MALDARAATRFRMHVLRCDPRFSYAECCPAGTLRGVLVVVHDSERKFLDCVHGFADFAARHGLVIVAPLFPPNVLGDEDEDGYKFLIHPGVRYDRLLLEMVREVQMARGLAESRFYLHGYSGGAQFVHRFALLHAQQLRAVSVASPGEVTLADETVGWWGGVGDTAEIFGGPVQWAAVGSLDWHLAVGDRDIDTAQLLEQPPSACWADDRSRLRSNRQDRLKTLWASLMQRGARVHFELLAGVEHHDGQQPARESAQVFFAQCLAVDAAVQICRSGGSQGAAPPPGEPAQLSLPRNGQS